MALSSESFQPPKKRVDPKKPQAGERAPTQEELDSFGMRVSSIVEIHSSNGNQIILADEDGKMPAGVVICVRDRSGLIGYAKDGAGSRIPGNLADVAGGSLPPPPPEPPEQPQDEEDEQDEPQADA